MNKIKFVNVTYHYNQDHPYVEFQRRYCSNAYELNTRHKAERIQKLGKQLRLECAPVSHIWNNRLGVTFVPYMNN